MSRTLLTHIKIFDGTGQAPFEGEVLIEGDRILKVARRGEPALDAVGAQVISGAARP